ncbi:type II secretion system F family protein [Nocardioides massiliensis]|uniref:Flp pilus assembly protein TadB n=1 Tax=Nocardioides massiliensis TaxID=1325935 RepID=A0ABT9NJS2_9ACTN|nr:type II secretion system F family protein [Nocardioides massiliensis]MDP9820656.1 Flp pilus assembly protein TadB [Nocardioides massiliensis]
MTPVLLLGAVAGFGVLLLVLQFDRGTGTAAAELARLDSARARASATRTLTSGQHRGDTESLRVRRFGARIWAQLEARGWRAPAGLRADLAVMGQSMEQFLGQTALGAVAGLVVPPMLLVLMDAVGLGLGSASIPVWVALIGALVGGYLTRSQLASAAKERRRDFRHVVSAFLDLVAMNLAGGRGVPEALQAASSISDGWAMVRIRDTMEAARLQGVTPWAALGDLGSDMAVEELRDLAAALALVAEDGAKVRDSLSARAASMRQRELADAESRAAEQSQSMLVAQLLLAVGFLLFLMYPAVANVLGI